MPDCTITLSISKTGSADALGFLFHILVDGQPIATNQILSPDQAKQIRQLSHQFNEQFESRYQPQVTNDNLTAIGADLFRLWLAAVWDKIAAAIPAGSTRTLLIASGVADVLNLPWELLQLPGGEFIAFDQKFSIRRLPRAENTLPKFNGQLPAGPLRVLFVACSPLNEAALDYEKEEESLVRVMAKTGSKVVFDSGDMGSYEELQERLHQFDPHVVYLTGHGIVKEDGLGYFCFEDERGNSDLRSSKELRALFAGSSVQCVFVSGCQTGKAPPISALGGICQGLVSEEVPLAIGWAASIADTVATEFATSFFKTLTAGQPIGRAMNQARQAIRKTCDEMGYPAWTLPVLYAATTQTHLFDSERNEKSRRPNLRLQPLPGMVEGYAEHFVGRRREIQRLLPALRDGSKQIVFLTGIGGAGKSTLATRLVRKLEGDGFSPMAISSTETSPLTSAQLLQTCGDAFLKAGLNEVFATLNNPQIPVDARLRYIISVLNEHRFVLVLDNFEVNLNETTRSILNPEVAEFYKHLLSNLIGDSRALITCRYLPADAHLPETAHEEPIGDFPEAQFVKLLLREPELEKRYYAGDLPQKLLRQLHELLGGTPRFLLQMREAIKKMTTAELWQELEKVKLPAPASPNEDAPGKLQKLREEYCQRIFTARLFSYLSEDSQRALCRAAVFGIPVNLAGLAAVSGESLTRLREFTRQWQDYALAFPEREKGDSELWAVYGLLRGWMLAAEQLPEADRLAAHKEAGDFLRDGIEQDREKELGLSWVECLAEAREHYLAAGKYLDARKATEVISGFLKLGGLYSELIRLNEEMLSFERHPATMNWIGTGYIHLSFYPQARTWFKHMLTEAGNEMPEMSGLALHQLGTVDLNEGDYAAAKEHFIRALDIRQQIGQRGGEAATLHQLATTDFIQGKYSTSQELYWRALDIFGSIGDFAGKAATLNGLATIDLKEGKYTEARHQFRQALALRKQIGDRAGEAATLHNLALIDLNEQNFPAALQQFQQALEIRQQIGDLAGEATTLHSLATIDLNESNHSAAIEKYRHALTINQQIGDSAGEASTFYQLGIVACVLRRPVESFRLIALSFQLSQAIDVSDVQQISETLNWLAAQLGYTLEQVQATISEVSREYLLDRGAILLRAAFGEE